MDTAAITHVPDAVHNPADPRHFMKLKPAGRRVRLALGATLLADTPDALRLLEVGRDVYDPVLYVPAADLHARLARTERTTHCPIKGDTVYFDLLDDAGQVLAREIAWQYPAPVAGAEALAERVAFDPARVTVEERPA